jgi:hypothetical protein
MEGRMAPTGVKDPPCVELDIALEFDVSGKGRKRVCDKKSLNLSEINEPKLPFLGVVEV